MKRYKKILMIWICAIVVVAVSVIVALYDNANQGQDVAKEVAVETLRKVAERITEQSGVQWLHPRLQLDCLRKIHVSDRSCYFFLRTRGKG